MEKLLHSNYFDTTVIFSEQLFLQSICSFDKLLVQNRHFFDVVIFFRIPTLWERNEPPPLENRKFFGVVTFWIGSFLAEELFRMKIFTKDLLFRNRCCCRASTFSEELHLWKSQFLRKAISHYPLFLKNYLFRAATFSNDVIFYSTRATFLQHTFSEELPFYSYVSFSQLHFLFVS